MIDMNKGAELKDQQITKPAVDDQAVKPAELINESTDKAEGIDETAPKQKQKKKKTIEEGVVVVKYIGGGVWKDSEGEYWAKSDMTQDILCERQYAKSEYDTRDDLKFMVNYGSMQISIVKE